MSRARQVILLADSGKAGKVSFARAGRLENVHAVHHGQTTGQDFCEGTDKDRNQIGESLKISGPQV